MSVRAQPAVKDKRHMRRFPRYRLDSRIQVSVFRDGRTMTINLRSADRASFLKKARLQ